MKTTSMIAKTVVFAAMITCVTAFGDLTSVQKERDIARTNELRRRLENEQLMRAQRLKDSFEIKVQETTQLLDRISQQTEAFIKERDALLVSDLGKRLVVNPERFKTFLNMYDNPAITISEVQSRRINAQSIFQAIQDERKEVDVGYLPSPELFEEINALNSWAIDRLPRLEVQKATLKTILEESPEINNPDGVKTLKKAIEEYRAKLSKLFAEASNIGEQLAENESKEIIIDAARLAVLEKSKAESDQIINKMRLEIAQLKLTYELETNKLKAEHERKRYESQKQLNDVLAELERTRKKDMAEEIAKDVEAEIEVKEILNIADREKKLAKLRDPMVQEMLSYFTADGYSQPGKNGVTREFGPVSYNRLQANGMLTPDEKGLANLLLHMNSYHSDRPRFCPRGKRVKGLSPEQHQRLVMIQDLLIELGPLMVEEGMLAR